MKFFDRFKREGKKQKSIGTYIFSSFLLTITIIFVLIWLCEVVFFDGFFKTIKRNQIEKIINETESVFVSYADRQNLSLPTEQKEKLLEMSVETNSNIVVFSIQRTSAGEKYNIYFSSSRITDSESLTKALSLLVEKLKETDRANFMNDTYEQSDTIIEGHRLRIEQANVYFYASTVITPSRYVLEILVAVLSVVTVLGVVIMLILAIQFSRKISSPIEEVAQKAKKIGGKNFDVEFSNREYREVSELSDTLNFAITEMKQSEQIQKDVIANVSHELRTPLTIVRSYAEMIRDLSGDNKTKREEHLKVILSETERLEYLVNDLLDLSKLQAGTYAYQFEYFNLANNLEKIKEFYKSKFTDFVFDFDFPSKIQIFADEKRIEQVLFNFINNAINYSKDEKRVIVRVIKDSDKGVWRVTATDYGVGISEADQATIFERHFRSNNTKRVTTGSGIGLFLVKQILNYHKFNFGVESELGKGSTFYFEIPF